MNWQEIQEISHSLSDAWIEACYELLGGELEVFRGRIQKVEWINGFPRFHLTNIVRFDTRGCHWIPTADREEPPPLGVPPGARGEKRNSWFTDPFRNKNGVIEFASLPNQSFSLFPRGTQLPALPLSSR